MDEYTLMIISLSAYWFMAGFIWGQLKERWDEWETKRQ